ncbi:MAG: glycosyltransferase family 2 protein [Clostridiaceae bacterium]|nr:glycosyltransferase family 2 protein [Clostridiaceae bacterium]
MNNIINDKVVAIVVTYNRKVLLQECLDAILDQSYSVKKIILIDNASTDGTREMLEEKGYINNPKIQYVLMDSNTGGSGGFYEGLKRAREDDCDWIWVMDDDTIPTDTCLEELIKAKLTISMAKDKSSNESAKISFLASVVYGPENEFMNVPTVSKKRSPNGCACWYEHLGQGVVSISNATFVSILVNKNAVLQCGLPCRDYFIWGDDTEYTLRLSRFFGDAYFIGNSVAIHKRYGAKALRIENETDSNRVKMFHYFYRNGYINRRYYKENYQGIFIELVIIFGSALKHLRMHPNGFIMAKTILRGEWEGITQYKKFKKYIEEQIRSNESK